MSDEFQVLVSGFALDGHEELRLTAVASAGPVLELVGTANVLNPGQWAATIYQLHVVNGWRGRGVGAAMVEKACSECMALESRAISAVVEQDGPLKFWQHLGFEVVHIEGKRMIVSKRLE
jgi:ribosomal protein S18 acetylase RimI-like enzyme